MMARTSSIACIACILSGVGQVAISTEALANGGTVPFQCFLVAGMVAISVGVAGLVVTGRSESSRAVEYAVTLIALATAVLTFFLAYYMNLGIGSI